MAVNSSLMCHSLIIKGRLPKRQKYEYELFFFYFSNYLKVYQCRPDEHTELEQFLDI